MSRYYDEQDLDRFLEIGKYRPGCTAIGSNIGNDSISNLI